MPYEQFDPQELILRDVLALDRTVLANERTFLAFFRTGLACALTGAGCIRLLDDWTTFVLGIALIILGAIIIAAGTLRYFQVRGSLKQVLQQPQQQR